MRLGWLLGGLMFLCTCSDSPDPARTRAQTAHASDAPALTGTSRTSGSPTRSSAPTASASGSPVAALPPLPDRPTHFSSTTTPSTNTSCAPLPATKNAYTPLAKAVRRLACEPALFLMSGDEVRRELALPADYTVELGGAASVSLRFPKGKAADLTTAMGVTGAVAKRRNKGAWGWRIWDLVNDTQAGSLAIWGPGELYVGLNVDEAGRDDKVESLGLEHATLDGYVSVSMPESVLPRVDDALASQHLVAGLNKIAEKKENLAAEPSELAKLAGLTSERFRLSRRTSSAGADTVKGIDVWTARTQIAAGPVIEALGLYGKIEHERAHDSDAHLLYVGTDSELGWRGLKIELRFEKRGGAPATGAYGEWLLEGITLMP